MTRSKEDENAGALYELLGQLGREAKEAPARRLNDARKALMGKSPPLADPVLSAHRTPFENIPLVAFHPTTGSVCYVGITPPVQGQTEAHVIQGFGDFGKGILYLATSDKVSDLSFPPGSKYPSFVTTKIVEYNTVKTLHWGPFTCEIPRETQFVLLWATGNEHHVWIFSDRYMVNAGYITKYTWCMHPGNEWSQSAGSFDEIGSVHWAQLLNNCPCWIEGPEFADQPQGMVRLRYKEFTSEWYEQIDGVCLDRSGNIQFLVSNTQNGDGVTPTSWIYVNQDGTRHEYSHDDYTELRPYVCGHRLMLVGVRHGQTPQSVLMDAGDPDDGKLLDGKPEYLGTTTQRHKRMLGHIFDVCASTHFIVILDGAEAVQKHSRHAWAWSIRPNDRLAAPSKEQSVSIEPAKSVHSLIELCGDVLMVTPKDAWWFMKENKRFALDCPHERLTEVRLEGQQPCALGWRFDEGTIFISRYAP